MKFRQRPQPELDVNITPLIDVVFLLLIFFMVSTTFKQDFEVSIELPKASSEDKLQNKMLNIMISPTGSYYLNNIKLKNDTALTLKTVLLETSKGNLALPIVISADGKTPHQAVIQAMDAARQAGFSKLTFATQQTAE